MDYGHIIQKARQTGGLLDVLRAVQQEEGFLSERGIRAVAEAFGRCPSEIYETATFYGMLHVTPQAQHTIEVCGSTCCDSQGAVKLIDALEQKLGIHLGETTADGRWKLARCECLGRCDTGPNALLDGRLKPNVSLQDVLEFMETAGE